MADFFDDVTLTDDTQTVGPSPSAPRPRPASDPAFFDGWFKNITYRNDSDAVVIRPEDPVFQAFDFNRSDRTPSLDTSVTPVWAVITEPLKGVSTDETEWTEYIPTSHVHFLEQTGAKVIPISYAVDQAKLVSLLDHCSGVYFTGDSYESPNNKRYQATFANALAYTIARSQQSDYFPMFLLGSTIQTFINNRVPDDVNIFKSIPGYLVNHNVKLRVTIDPQSSFILDELTTETLSEYMLEGAFFNKQRFGLKVRDFLKESILSPRYQIVATINNQPD